MTNSMDTSAGFNLSHAQFKELSGIVEAITGISFPDSKQALVHSRLAKRVRALQMQSFDEYCQYVKSAEGGDEILLMAEALTTNVTKFFREDHHFQHFSSSVFPALAKTARAGGRVRIWSAGCSSGQEPYSIALSILSVLPDARAYDIKILATDINSQVLAAGEAGRYPAEDLLALPTALRNSWTERTSDGFVFDDAVRRLISFRRLNLLEAWPMAGLFDVIFCRNVMIYFNQALQVKLWQRFTQKLMAGGVMYIGHSERVSGPAAHDLTIDGTTTYRKAMRAVA